MQGTATLRTTKKKYFEVFGMPLYLFLFPIISVLLGHFTDSIPSGVVGGFCFMFTFGIVFGEIGDRLPIWKEYIGGGTVLVFIASAYFVYQGWFTEREIKLVSDIMKETKFLDLYIVVLITGAILSVNRKLLIKSFVGYIPTILAGVLGASVLGVLGGLVFGISPKDIMMLYVLPSMGGGNGAGSIPLAEIYESTTGNSKDMYYSYAIAILTIANIWAIIMAAVLNKIGNKKPKLTGYGELVRIGKLDVQEDEEIEVSGNDMTVGMILGVSAYVFAIFLEKQVYSGIHYYAYMVIIIAVFNALGIVPLAIKQGSKKLQNFFSKQFTWLLMVGVGIAYTNLGEIIAAFTPANVIVAFMIVLGAVLGTGLVGHLMGFYAIEAAITAGLCMANRGGSGDIAVLGAANRMNLISYGQISSRLGGGLVLIIASFVFKLLAG